jgi:hypothetical protein
MAPWSKLKSRIEALWPDDLPLAIHCTSYDMGAHAGTTLREQVSRHWFQLGKTIVWDFPGPFLREDRARGGPVEHASIWHPNGGTIIGELLREYLDRPRRTLFEPFVDDNWELTDMLRAADRRLGRAALEAWRAGLDAGHPAHSVLDARLGPGR